MGRTEKCPECNRLESEYEAATMEWFRVQGQLRIAEYSRAADASQQITEELTKISKRRDVLRNAKAQHETEAHSQLANGSV